MNIRLCINMALIMIVMNSTCNAQENTNRLHNMVEVVVKGHTLYYDTVYQYFYYNRDIRLQKIMPICDLLKRPEGYEGIKGTVLTDVQHWIWSNAIKDSTIFYNSVTDMFNKEELEYIFSLQNHNVFIDIYINLDGEIANVGLYIDPSLHHCINDEKIYAILKNVMECNADFSDYLQNVKKHGYADYIDEYKNFGNYFITCVPIKALRDKYKSLIHKNNKGAKD